MLGKGFLIFYSLSYFFFLKTTAVRAIPAIGKKVGEELEFGGLLGSGPVMNINQTDCSVMIHRKGRIPAPIQALKN